MNPYFLFSYADYYPAGGMRDFVERFATLEEAMLPQQRLDDNSEIWKAQGGDFFVVAEKSLGSKWHVCEPVESH